MTIVDEAFIALHSGLKLHCLTQFTRNSAIVWIGETQDCFIYGRCNKGMVSVGVGDSEMEAKSNIKLIAVNGRLLDPLYAKATNVTVDELLDIMNWKVKPNQLLIWPAN